MLEKWKDIKGYEGYYQISNMGYVRSLRREIWRRDNTRYKTKGCILKFHKTIYGYYQVGLRKKNCKRKHIAVHCLVWDAFGNEKRNGKKLQVDHIDNDKTNNRIDNLQLLSLRLNVSKGFLQKPKTSQYTGVCWAKSKKKWNAYISVNYIRRHLGYFHDEYKAHLTYQRALANLGEI
jgi:hypothetical protein